jgi:hypothetical protein
VALSVVVWWGPFRTAVNGTAGEEDAEQLVVSPLHLPTHRSGVYLVCAITPGLSLRDDALSPLLGPCCLDGELIDQLVHRVP